jgi:hypothetical protein
MLGRYLDNAIFEAGNAQGPPAPNAFLSLLHGLSSLYLQPARRTTITTATRSRQSQTHHRHITTANMSETKEFTFSDVSEHTTKKDLYMVIHEKVYDSSSFVDEHP